MKLQTVWQQGNRPDDQSSIPDRGRHFSLFTAWGLTWRCNLFQSKECCKHFHWW